MKEPTLVIMAAGLGSRYGGLKQMDPINEQREFILDFSLYDAKRAGFKQAIFIIRKEMEQELRRRVDQQVGKHMEITYVFQRLDDLPGGYHIPEGREKPWGTGHAVLSCKAQINGPFAVINADDFYGERSFQMVYDFLSEKKGEQDYCLAGFFLENTISEHGFVSRGVCKRSREGSLLGVTERTKIKRHGGKIAYVKEKEETRKTPIPKTIEPREMPDPKTEETWQVLDPKTIVSMNFWGFQENFMKETEERFAVFLEETLKKNPLKGEYLLPAVVDSLIKEKKAFVQVLQSPDKWYGITYKEDKAGVMAALCAMKEKGLYPEKLWG